MSWWVYMVETASGKLYTGITTDVERRFQEHCGVNSDDVLGAQKGAKFFRSDAAKQVRYREPCANRSEASQREVAIKRLPKSKKWRLVSEYESA